MRDVACPPFPLVLFYLSCIIGSCALIGYALIGLSPVMQQNAPWIIPVVLTAAGLVIVYCSFNLAQGLFPARFRRCPVCSLVREIIEIDGVVR